MELLASRRAKYFLLEGKKKFRSFISSLGRFGNRNLEKEAVAMSLKMERQGIKGLTSPNTDSLLSKEELALVEKDRTPG